MVCPPGNFCRAELEDQIQKVRELRVALESRTQELHEQQVAFNQQHKNLIEAKCKAASDCTEAESQLRHMTLAAYHDKGNKKPAEGVGIRISKSLIILPLGVQRLCHIQGILYRSLCMYRRGVKNLDLYISLFDQQWDLGAS